MLLQRVAGPSGEQQLLRLKSTGGGFGGGGGGGVTFLHKSPTLSGGCQKQGKRATDFERRKKVLCARTSGGSPGQPKEDQGGIVS